MQIDSRHNTTDLSINIIKSFNIIFLKSPFCKNALKTFGRHSIGINQRPLNAVSCIAGCLLPPFKLITKAFNEFFTNALLREELSISKDRNNKFRVLKN